MAVKSERCSFPAKRGGESAATGHAPLNYSIENYVKLEPEA
jgi:hypothetical protein